MCSKNPQCVARMFAPAGFIQLSKPSDCPLYRGFLGLQEAKPRSAVDLDLPQTNIVVTAPWFKASEGDKDSLFWFFARRGGGSLSLSLKSHLHLRSQALLLPGSSRPRSRLDSMGSHGPELSSIVLEDPLQNSPSP